MRIIVDFSSIDATTAMITAWFCFLLYAVLHSPILVELVRRPPPAPPAAPAPMDSFADRVPPPADSRPTEDAPPPNAPNTTSTAPSPPADARSLMERLFPRAGARPGRNEGRGRQEANQGNGTSGSNDNQRTRGSTSRQDTPAGESEHRRRHPRTGAHLARAAAVEEGHGFELREMDPQRPQA
ncbi:hypothetical protein CDV55_100428 [Aspergillus turcosus]|uniref:Uncharacterized protein n=1 Tax=Aspergillus turcosus TaxID=1245748 RepID=A0A397H226_9EURO|nr:hypothetical protein CDV55_100428 [Aspergillus turcosus]RLL95265.1 hypothetical protein CFD26_100432 [Aspergillus turcosus]